MTKVFVVTTVVKEQRNNKEVTLGAYTDKEQAFKVAQESITKEEGVLSHLIAIREEAGCKVGLVDITEGNTTMWGIWFEGVDWHAQCSFRMAAKVEEVEIK